MWVLLLSAVIEIATGLGLIAVPQTVSRLLLGAPLEATAITLARIAGAALLALGVICLLGRAKPRPEPQTIGMMIYNVLATILIGAHGLAGGSIGPLLWPAVALHAVIGLLLVRIAVRDAP